MGKGARRSSWPSTHPPSRSRRHCRRASAGPGPRCGPASWAGRGTGAGTADWLPPAQLRPRSALPPRGATEGPTPARPTAEAVRAELREPTYPGDTRQTGRTRLRHWPRAKVCACAQGRDGGAAAVRCEAPAPREARATPGHVSGVVTLSQSQPLSRGAGSFRALCSPCRGLPLRGEAGLRGGPGSQAWHWQRADALLASSGWQAGNKAHPLTAERGRARSGVLAGACLAAGILLLSIAW